MSQTGGSFCKFLDHVVLRNVLTGRFCAGACSTDGHLILDNTTVTGVISGSTNQFRGIPFA
ncbi:hypothetical protein JVU11DRAFT_11466 [Chiua virens]|nr:hypothetical protein JVU11DRAFT_11466 [Chiua virens]